MERLQYDVGDIVKLKKPHPCGSQEWEILRVGADFRLRCLGCGHQVMVPRKLVEKNTRGLTKNNRKRKGDCNYEENDEKNNIHITGSNDYGNSHSGNGSRNLL